MLRDTGGDGCIVKSSLVLPDQFTGARISLCIINNSLLSVTEAKVYVETYFTEWIFTDEPMVEVITGNIPGVMNFPDTEKAIQVPEVSAPVMIRGIRRQKKAPAQLQAMKVKELVASKNIQQESKMLIHLRWC